MTIDDRHFMLLASTMTYKGKVNGYTRTGLKNTKSSVLNLASFETCHKHLFEAAYRGQTDTLSGVSEKIITGNRLNLGTGSIGLIFNEKPDTRDSNKFPKTRLLFDQPEFHPELESFSVQNGSS